MTPLPIDAVLPDLLAALRAGGRAVLQAPPGAGKTTRVPLAILEAGLTPGRILMLEPRRLAARAAAERMAETLGEAVGRTVGYRMRGEARVSAATRIEVVTEGILTRMIQDDPGLDGVGAVIFDEFHERSLAADLGLALVMDLRAVLRPDLILLVMSATLDAAPVAAHLGGAPLVTAEGRAYPVETRWLPRPLPAAARVEVEAARLIARALEEVAKGALLAFLPGEAEIRRVAGMLDLPAGCVLRPLYGAMPFADQRAAIAPEPGLRKVVLATAIAETALTIPEVRVVVDAGLARRARFDPASGMTRLVTEPVTRAEAEQRRGRAGRVAPGVCYRLWARAEEGALPAFPPPEIAAADLTGLALDLAAWGSDDLPFLTPPPAPALAEGRALLAGLGALDAGGRITPHGQAMARLPLHPRLAHLMLAGGGPQAATVAALLADRDPLRGAAPDLDLRLRALADPGARFPVPVDRGAVDRIRAEAKRLAPSAGPDRGLPVGALAALAYPDRIGLRREGEAPRWLLSGGRGVAMDPGLPMSGAPMLVATDLDGTAREARIRQAADLPRDVFLTLFAGDLRRARTCAWDARAGRVVARERVTFGALVVEDRPWPDAPPEAVARAALDGLRQLGLPWTPAAARLRDRIARAGLLDVTEAALLNDDLLPWLAGRRSADDLRALDLTEALRARLGWDGQQALDRLCPANFTTPVGRNVPIDYAGEAPAVAVRLQEMFGLTIHPAVGADRRPLRITLLSPGGKPVQVTSDLPGFWADSYADVRRDLRGRYPRHPWPEDPTAAAPTLRAKPRGT